jgi:tetratricopeptide (TPR) repeat protein
VRQSEFEIAEQRLYNRAWQANWWPMFFLEGPLMIGSGKRPQAAPSASSALARLAAQTQLDFELDFFASLLDRHPDFIEVLKAHAKNLATARRHGEGLIVDQRLTQLRPTDSLARYNLACSLALMQNRDQALAELRLAVELGYRDFSFMKRDRDLDSIRTDPRYRALVREYDRKN